LQNLKTHTDPKVKEKFDVYPKNVRGKLDTLRNLIIETANELENIAELEETLKWGEPSYIAKKGSTVRIDWKSKTPNQYAIYFKCTSKLVITFKEMYSDIFEFEGNRAIVFQMDNKLPTKELKKCIAAALTYHTVKHLPRLGI
jgi:hypothetical protein